MMYKTKYHVSKDWKGKVLLPRLFFTSRFSLPVSKAGFTFYRLGFTKSNSSPKNVYLKEKLLYPGSTFFYPKKKISTSTEISIYLKVKKSTSVQWPGYPKKNQFTWQLPISTRTDFCSTWDQSQFYLTGKNLTSIQPPFYLRSTSVLPFSTSNQPFFTFSLPISTSHQPFLTSVLPFSTSFLPQMRKKQVFNMFLIDNSNSILIHG